jgi:hypothetical protein
MTDNNENNNNTNNFSLPSSPTYNPNLNRDTNPSPLSNPFFNAIHVHKREYVVCLQHLEITEILIKCYKEGIITINNDGDIVIMYPAMFYNYYFNFKRKLCGVFMDAILSKRRILAGGGSIDTDYIWITAQERYEHVITKPTKWIVIHELVDKGILIKENVRKYKVYKLNLDNKKVKELLDFIFDNPAFVIE